MTTSQNPPLTWLSYHNEQTPAGMVDGLEKQLWDSCVRRIETAEPAKIARRAARQQCHPPQRAASSRHCRATPQSYIPEDDN
eukprot:CAMPEP_0114313220 /NCGR_PEP_ID=MMETSP0059-20121206/20966_1 /TAXON_ID=36894 /ORGANISM="Pyramimonas parkeae, Strain CCMP726" /LENGTH=81 /DNA_ID=CAMNT_0001437895 /DNA_START=269 /DNA_END=511 /DNA_ORIENTATION=+